MASVIKHTPAEWAFRWLWNQPEVTCVFSGMNSLTFQEYMLCTVLRKELKNAKKELEGPIFKIAEKFASIFLKY